MAKTKNTFTPVGMPGLGSEFDDVFKDDFKVEPKNRPNRPPSRRSYNSRSRYTSESKEQNEGA